MLVASRTSSTAWTGGAAWAADRSAATPPRVSGDPSDGVADGAGETLGGGVAGPAGDVVACSIGALPAAGGTVGVGTTAPGASGMSSPPSLRSRKSLSATFQFFASQLPGFGLVLK